MVTQKGRFGARQEVVTEEKTEQVTPEAIRNVPEIPPGRFGRGLAQTKALQERGQQLRRVRQEAIDEAERLEKEFFSQKITIQQAEEGYEQVDPLVRQFIRTTPEARRQLARDAVRAIDDRILTEERNIERLRGRGGDFDEIEIVGKQQLIYELQQLRDEAESGAFSYGELLSFAEQRANARQERARGRRQARETLKESGVPRDIINKILSQRGGKITLTSAEAQRLSPQARQALGITQSQTTTETITTTRPPTLNELIQQGIPADIARKLLSTDTPTLTIEEARRLPSNVRQELGVTEDDFKTIGTTSIQRVGALESLNERIKNAKTFREKIIYKTPLVAPLAIEAAFADLGAKTADVAVNKGFRLPLPIFGMPAGKQVSLGKEGSRIAVATAFDIGTFSLPVLSQIRQVTFTSSVGGKIVTGDKVVFSLKPEQNQVSILDVAGAGAITGFATKRFLSTEKLITREAPKEIDSKATTLISSFRQGEKQVDIAQFVITSTKESRKAFVTTRAEIFKQKVFGVALPKGVKSLDQLTVKQAQFVFKGRVIEIEKASSAVLATEPFLTKGGRVLRPAFRDSDVVAFALQKATASRKSPATIGKFGGALEKETMKFRLVRPEKLSAMDKKLFKELEKRFPAFKTEADFFKGEAFTKDLLKVLKGGKELRILTLEKSARSTRRTRFVGRQEEKVLLQQQKEFGLKEVEFLEEKMTFADITFPRSRKPRRVDSLQGKTIRKEFELPPQSIETPKDLFRRKPSTSRNKLDVSTLDKEVKQLKVSEKSISLEASKGSLGMRAKLEARKSRPVSTNKIEQQLRIKTGIQERVATGGALASISKGSFKEDSKVQSRLQPRVMEREIIKLSGKANTKLTPRLSAKTSAKEINKLSSKLTSKLSTKLINKQVTRPRPPTFKPSKNPSRKIVLPFKLPKYKPLELPRKRKRRGGGDEALVEGFSARILGLRGQKIREKDLDKALKAQKNILGVRLRPIVLPDRRKR